MLINVYNQKNEKVGEIDLPEKIFGVKWNPNLVHQVLTVQLARSRQRLAHVKGRGEVRGGGRKPWRQKGTGRARHGSIRSPIWRGGGVTHGPTNEKQFTKKINAKMKQLAVFSVLSRKLKDGELLVLDSLKTAKQKTKELTEILKNFSALKTGALLVASSVNKNISQIAANIKKVGTLSPKSLNVSDLLRYRNIILEKDAIEEIKKHYHEYFK